MIDVSRKNRLVTAVVAGAAGFYPVSTVVFEFGVVGERAVAALAAVSFAAPALIGWVLYPSARTILYDSRIAHERLVGWLYYLGAFSIFSGVGARAAYAVGTRLGLGGSLIAWTTAWGVISGVSLSVLFWRD